MPLLPYRRYELVSTNAPSEVEAALRAAVEPERIWRFRAATRPFEGEVGDAVFDVRRTIGYRNSFLPQIRGKISAAPEGSRIAITMRLHPLVLAFMILWLGGVGVGCISILFAELQKGGAPFKALGPAGMFIFGWVLSAGGFTFEARKASVLLASTMVARPTTDAVQPRVATDGAARRR